ncbi:helix-turn-helix transcriptional regulator [Nocardia nova]|uniref:helix-turn-helix transcriptional regulator n=1 Tax=Nocardia nova TaxID=37330 RepID=UPI00046CB0EE|nr:YafY family protein [Nocardia nova]
MTDTTQRLLTLLSLLQTPREWPGPELAERLGVSERTVRRDIDRLRALDYPVQATMGVYGGYRLEAGTAMPPLLLDDAEAVSTAVGLRTVAAHALTGADEAAVRALAKLEQVLPARLRARVRAVGAATEVLAEQTDSPVDTAVLTALAAAIGTGEQVRFGYRANSGAETRRLADPHRLVAAGHRWYLVAFDRDRDDWRIFRVDRIVNPLPIGLRAAIREVPGGDAANFVRDSLYSLAPVHRAEITVFAGAAEIAATGIGEVEAADEHSCRVTTAADTLPWLLLRLIRLGHDFRVDGPPELAAYVGEVGERLQRAAPANRPSRATVTGISQQALSKQYRKTRGELVMRRLSVTRRLAAAATATAAAALVFAGPAAAAPQPVDWTSATAHLRAAAAGNPAAEQAIDRLVAAGPAVHETALPAQPFQIPAQSDIGRGDGPGVYGSGIALNMDGFRFGFFGGPGTIAPNQAGANLQVIWYNLSNGRSGTETLIEHNDVPVDTTIRSGVIDPGPGTVVAAAYGTLWHRWPVPVSPDHQDGFQYQLGTISVPSFGAIYN